MWHTKVKALLALTLALINAYDFIYNQPKFLVYTCLAVLEISVWLFCPLVLIFDLRRALHHDWSLHYPFIVCIVGRSLFTLVIIFGNLESFSNYQPVSMVLLEVLTEAVLMLLMFKYPRDYPYSRKLRAFQTPLLGSR